MTGRLEEKVKGNINGFVMQRSMILKARTLAHKRCSGATTSCGFSKDQHGEHYTY